MYVQITRRILKQMTRQTRTPRRNRATLRLAPVTQNSRGRRSMPLTVKTTTMMEMVSKYDKTIVTATAAYSIAYCFFYR